jgi:glutathione S-transferase
MSQLILLRGYRYSVYTRIARMVLEEKGIAYAREEIDPFSPDLSADYLRRHPFGRVPVLSHGGFDVYETAAIARYVDAGFDGPELLPQDAERLARVAQVVSVVDSYGYWPMIRQVFAQRVFRTALGEQADEAVIAAGLTASGTVLAALDRFAAEGLVLTGREITLADCHLAPMIAYFVQAPEAEAALHRYGALSGWWRTVSSRASLRATDPGLPSAE